MRRDGAGILSALLIAAATAVGADWAALEPFQRTITADRFDALAHGIYAPSGELARYIEWRDGGIVLFPGVAHTGEPLFRLEFADPGAEREAPRTFRLPAEIRAARGDGDPPLAGLRVALDPGHIGGAWARMEERFHFTSREDWFVQEAALNLLVARLARDRLEALGATVLMTKDDFEPVTDERPGDFAKEAAALVGEDPRFAHLPELFRRAAREDRIRKAQEAMFYRTSEIAARARKVNEVLKPDVTLAIHFNAIETGDRWEQTDANGLAFFVHGNYTPAELSDNEQKFFLFRKLLEGSHAAEMDAGRAFVGEFRAATGLPPAYRTRGGNLHPVDDTDYLYARNLAANRRFAGPVIYLEPYFMNNADVYARIQAGDFDGERDIAGASRRSIFREYADAIVASLLRAYGP